MRHVRRLTFTFWMLAGLLVACSGSRGTGEPVDLDGTEWVLISLEGVAPIEGTRVTLAFGAEGLSGFAGCNSYGGAYEASDNGALHPGEMWQHLQGCLEPAGVMEQERAYMEALGTVAAYRTVDNRLELQNAAGETTLVYAHKEQPAMDPAGLVGTCWRLVAAESDLSTGEEPVTLAFRDGHVLAGQAGCRGYVGGYEADEHDLRLYWLAMMDTGRCLQQGLLADWEGAYTTILESIDDYQLSSERLEVVSVRGERLVFAPVEASASLEGTEWALIAFVERREVEGLPGPQWMPTDPLPGTEITLAFEDGEANGSAGCNAYGGGYTLEGSSLALGTLAATEMACAEPEGVMGQEARYLEALSGVARYRIDGSQLWLETNGGHALVFAASQNAAEYGASDLIADLRAAGWTVERTGQQVDHGFSIAGERILVGETPTYVYEFADNDAADVAAAGVSMDEYSMTVTRLKGEGSVVVHSDWIETPHLFKRGRLIAVVGDDAEVVEALSDILGP